MNNQTKTMTSMVTSYDIWDGSIATGFAGGNGTEEEPYLIKTASQFAYLKDGVNSSNLYLFNKKYYELTADLDLAEIEWTPIGSTSSLFSIFFDGKNHTIKGLAVHSSDKNNKGLFGNVNVDSYIKNLKVTNAYVSGNSYVGGIVAQMKGTLENCHFSGHVVGQYSNIGGIVGRLTYGLITGCGNSGTISGSNILTTCGGIVGGVTSGSVLYCQNHGALACYASAGGIAGNAKDIRYCSNTGSVSGTSNSIGGIVGTGEVIEGCMNTGMISGEASAIGGIAGIAESVIHSFNMAEIKGSNYLGGIIGKMSYYVDTTIQNCYNIGTITGNNYIGGIVPNTSTSKALYITDCYNHGTITANKYKGALLGYVSSSVKKPILTNSYYLLGSADTGVGTGVAEYEEVVVTVLKPLPVLELLSETIKKLIGDSIDLIFTVGKELLSEIIKVIESFYQLLVELAESEGSTKNKVLLTTKSVKVRSTAGTGATLADTANNDIIVKVSSVAPQKALAPDGVEYNWIKVRYYKATYGEDPNSWGWVEGWAAEELTDEVSTTTPSKSMLCYDDDYLSQGDMLKNARYIKKYLLESETGWRNNAIYGMFGNIETESNFSPGFKERGVTNPAQGIVQWYPFTKYVNWANAEGYTIIDMDSQIERILYELDNGIQWQSDKHNSNTSFKDFVASEDSPETLAELFLYCYEQPPVKPQVARCKQARKWHDILELLD